MAWLRQPYRFGRWAALVVVTAAVLVLVPATAAAAEVVRLRVDWARADGNPSGYPPFLVVRSEFGTLVSQYQALCVTPAGCGAGSVGRWVQQNFDAGGQPRTISFVDQTATQYSSYSFTAQHKASGYGIGPNIVGTATITHADGRSYTVPFDLPPGPPGGVAPVILLGDSQGLPQPPPPPSPTPQTCTISYLKQFGSFDPLLKASVREFAVRWRTGDRLIFNNVYACGKGKITGRVMRLGRGRPVLIAKGQKILDYHGPGRAGTKLKLTRRGRTLRAKGTTFRAKATIRVFDGDGASITYSQVIKLRHGRPPITPPRR
jgi:hypothetical protein